MKHGPEAVASSGKWKAQMRRLGNAGRRRWVQVCASLCIGHSRKEDGVQCTSTKATVRASLHGLGISAFSALLSSARGRGPQGAPPTLALSQPVVRRQHTGWVVFSFSRSFVLRMVSVLLLNTQTLVQEVRPGDTEHLGARGSAEKTRRGHRCPHGTSTLARARCAWHAHWSVAKPAGERALRHTMQARGERRGNCGGGRRAPECRGERRSEAQA